MYRTPSIRLPTIVIRPGKPNKASSGFFSSILREPLSGQEAVLPVSESPIRYVAAEPRKLLAAISRQAVTSSGDRMSSTRYIQLSA